MGTGESDPHRTQLLMKSRERSWNRDQKSPEESSGIKVANPGLIPEQLLAHLWQQRAARRQQFKTNGGRLVRVLYPGRPSSSAGPDFRDAVFHLEGLGLVHGAVEIHRRQQDWDSHAHGADPNYNGVVLHAALEVAGGDTRLQNGLPVPVISLASLLGPADPPIASNFQTGEALYPWALLGGMGYPRPGSGEQMADLLDRAGDARFQQKSARFQAFLREQDPEQVLYEGICEGLGYRHNQPPFLKLAHRAPYWGLSEAARDVSQQERAGALESWLLKLAGLTESPGLKLPGLKPPGLKPPGTKLPRRGWGPAMAPSEWHCFRVRPANHPRLRVAGAAGPLS